MSCCLPLKKIWIIDYDNVIKTIANSKLFNTFYFQQMTTLQNRKITDFGVTLQCQQILGKISFWAFYMRRWVAYCSHINFKICNH